MAYLIFSTKIAHYLIKKTNASADKKEILAYAIEIISFNFINIGMSLFIGYILGVLPGTAVCLLTVFAIRIFAGGAHSNSAWRCAIITALLFPSMGLLANKAWLIMMPLIADVFILISFIISSFLLFFLAPIDSPNAPILSLARRTRLKKLSLVSMGLIASITTIIRLSNLTSTELLICIAFGVIWSSFILTPTAHKLFKILDNPKLLKGKEV